MSFEPKRRSWISKYASRPSSSHGTSNTLATPQEGKRLSFYDGGEPLSRAITIDSDTRSRSRPTSGSFSTHSSSPPTKQNLDKEASDLILNALHRTTSEQLRDKDKDNRSGSFGKLSLSSMMGGLSLSLSRSNNSGGNLASNVFGAANAEDAARGRTLSTADKSTRSSSAAATDRDASSRSRSRARSQSPFSFRRFRSTRENRDRDASPPPNAIPLAQSDNEGELSDAPPSSSIRPRNAFTLDHGADSDDENATEAETDDEYWSEDDDFFDPITEANTEQNALTAPTPAALDAEVDVDPDPLGEGVNVVVPPEPYFPTTLNSSGTRKRNPRRRKSVKHHDPLPLQTSRPIFKRDRCTITLTQGDPSEYTSERSGKRYIVASDMSEESRYAVEWGIGTVLRDGDEMLIVTVVENEAKVDPPSPNTVDRATKLRSQQERQGLAYILVRQATGLLQRTRLHVRVSCQAWHAKNSRHMLLDIVDYNEPKMLIVGSRGLGQLKGILLGSTSHYLIQKCSVPVMVARRRLKRPPRRQAHLSTHRTHVSLAEAGIDRVADKVDQDVQVMREQVEKDDKRREREEENDRDAEAEDDDEEDGAVGVKVAGT